ncbi:hypothetical protein AVEN_208432-1 [Araneus ventricosus]|uniref:Uncharacterized protein n=1 Tax=Araneus ventricosus TaxID=182803 RepID=A0A4Y2EG92_ARAVE|nr:hypothetical protein AVEN_208432-1 [Araneus ventricosus]
MTFGWVRLLGLLIFAGTDVGVALYSRYVEDEKSRTSYAAHFAGALAGLMIGMVCLRNLKIKKWEQIVSWTLFGVFCVLMLFAILWNAFYTSYYPPQVYD